MPQYKMLIDLRKCVGCGACAMACKTGNNTQARYWGQTFNWADFMFHTEGTFPNTKWQATPVMCNHCVDPACVAACPVRPDANGRKAVYKTADGIVVNNQARCIGCRRCQNACPYSSFDVRYGTPKPQYSVISYNYKTAHRFWEGTTAAIPGCTSSPAEVVANSNVGTTPPNRTKWTYVDGGAVVQNIRNSKVVEKCTLCIHRLGDNDLPADKRKPYCVLACPAQAREITTADPDPTWKVLKPGGDRTKAELVSQTDPLFSALGTVKPQVFYKNAFSQR